MLTLQRIYEVVVRRDSKKVKTVVPKGVDNCVLLSQTKFRGLGCVNQLSLSF